MKPASDTIKSTGSAPCPRRLLMLLNPTWMYINTIRDYCESFDLYSRHEIHFASTAATDSRWQAFSPFPDLDYRRFDGILIHYSCRPCFGDRCMHPDVEAAIKRFDGYKGIFLQDEYERTESTRKWITEYGMDQVFTCVPEPYLDKVYPNERFPGVTFTNCLTGYIPPSLEGNVTTRPLSERPFHIVYRGREVGFSYGQLVREKWEIGKVVRESCRARNIPVDIEWAKEKRIYGPDWNDFLQSGRATLGTESGSNVFDLDGSIFTQVEEALKDDPSLSYEEVRDRFFEDDNLGVRMNQISPKLFEFIASRTALILFEGQYSGILEPGIHFLSLRKDYSNLDEILNALEDVSGLEEMIERAHRDVIASGKYNYPTFVDSLDDLLEKQMARKGTKPWTPEFGDPRNPGSWPTDPLPMEGLQRAEMRRWLGRHLRGGAELFEAKRENFAGMISRREEKLAKLKAKLD